MRLRDVLVDVAAAAAGVAASWVVADLIVAAADRRRPLLLDPLSLPEQFGDEHERIQGVFHLGLAIQDGMHVAYHVRAASLNRRRPRVALRHAFEAGHSVATFVYHTAFAYVRHRDAQRGKR